MKVLNADRQGMSTSRINPEKLTSLVAEGYSLAELAAQLEMSKGAIRRQINNLGLQLKRGKDGRRTWSDDQLHKAVASSSTVSEVILKLGLSKKAAGNWATVNFYIKEQGLDTSHFWGKSWVASPNRTAPRKIELDAILVEDSTYRSSALIKRLFEEGVKERKCEGLPNLACGLKNWHGEHLSFELDHINGNSTDNRLENLRVLCPNCHSQTSTWRRMKTKPQRGPQWKCECGKAKDAKASQCLECRKAERVQEAGVGLDLALLAKQYATLKSVTAVAKLHRLSDNGLRAKLRSQGLDPKEIFAGSESKPL